MIASSLRFRKFGCGERVRRIRRPSAWLGYLALPVMPDGMMISATFGAINRTSLFHILANSYSVAAAT
jgi:hypothetical protein